MARHTTEFQTIRSEGGLLPPDLLRRVIDPKEKLDGTRPEDYGLPQNERLNEVITQAWNRLRKHWAEFRAAAAKLTEGEAGTGLTNDKWSLPLLRELGFGLLPSSAGPEINGRTYAINRFFGPMPIHLVGCGLSLDRRAAGVRGAAAANPHGLVQDFLNRASGHLWAIVSNGLRLRLLRDSQALSRQSFLEFDLEAMFVGEVYSDFVLLWLMAHATRFAPRENDPAKTCWLEQWTKLANEQGARALGDLRGGVERALQILGEGFTSHPKNAELREALRTGQMSLAGFHGQLLRIVYRLIFLFVAEDRMIDGRPLLHPLDDSYTAQLARERYAAHYSTARLRDMAAQIKGSRHGDLWRQFHLLTGALSGQASFAVARQHLALPALGSFLWDPASTASLNDAELTNHDFLEALRDLAFTRQDKVLRPVDYKNLGAEELGGVYESLLALTPQISADGARFTFAEFAGNERKTSGSYYTHDSLVQCLLDSALDPLVEEAIKGKTGAEAEKAVLALKICDPAVGSGHFLVGVAHRLARHLARVRAPTHGDSEPSPLLYQHALRDVIGRCLYGVDVNPMAAELCRVSLWLEALEPGKPLSFLDHHIRVGNSLLGATPELIAEGIPDEAFTAIEGDDKKACAALKKRNKAERAGRGPLFAEQDAETQALLQQVAAELEALPDDRPEEIRAKELAFRHHEETEEYRHKKYLADAWCAAFVIRKHFREPGRESSAMGITQSHLNDLAAGGDLPADLSEEIVTLRRQYQFFHWHLAFPEVFSRGGFDVILGNPPWEKIKLQEREFFATVDPAIAQANTAADRKRLIQRHRDGDTAEWKLYTAQLELDTKTSRFCRKSGRYPLTAAGEANTYSLFAELSTQIVANAGYVGLILKTGIVNAVENAEFYGAMVASGWLRSVRDFKNWKGWFPDVGYHERFSLVTFSKHSAGAPCTYAFNCVDISDAFDANRVYELSKADIELLNPNIPVCPVFSTARDLALSKLAYQRFPPLVNESKGLDPWRIRYSRMFDMTSDSGAFVTLEQLQDQGALFDTMRSAVCDSHEFVPLLEGKHIHSYSHRFGTFDDVPVQDRFGIKAAAKPLTLSQLSDPYFEPLPRYWVSKEDLLKQCPKPIIDRRWCIAFRDVTNLISNARTTMAAIAPVRGFGNSAALLYSEAENWPWAAAQLVGLMASVPFDFFARQKMFGAHLNKYILWQLPCPTPSQLSDFCLSGLALDHFVLGRVLELVYVTWSLQPFAQDCGWNGSPFVWDEERRVKIRCELDAAYFLLYSIPRADIDYIMDTFPIVKRRDEERFNGDYRTKRVILEIYDALAEAERTGQPYQTRLDPPPGDPRCCHPPRGDKVVAQ
jgi:hypothetical protein